MEGKPIQTPTFHCGLQFIEILVSVWLTQGSNCIAMELASAKEKGQNTAGAVKVARGNLWVLSKLNTASGI